MLGCDKCAYEGYKTCRCQTEEARERRDLVNRLRGEIARLHEEVEDLKLQNRVLQSTLDYFKTEEDITNIKKFYQEYTD